MFGNKFSSSTGCSGWLHETTALGVCAAGKITSSTSHQMAQNASESDGGSHRWAFLWGLYRIVPKRAAAAHGVAAASSGRGSQTRRRA